MATTLLKLGCISYILLAFFFSFFSQVLFIDFVYKKDNGVYLFYRLLYPYNNVWIFFHVIHCVCKISFLMVIDILVYEYSVCFNQSPLVGVSPTYSCLPWSWLTWSALLIGANCLTHCQSAKILKSVRHISGGTLTFVIFKYIINSLVLTGFLFFPPFK